MTARIDPARPPAPDPAFNRHGEPRRRAPRAIRAIAITPQMLEGAPEFDPVPRGSSRYDGWTPDRQRAFVKMLAELGCVSRAARAVGMSEVGAYLLRKAPGGEGFARAWEEAQSVGVARLSDVALERALYGIPVPIFHKGEQIGERRWYDNRLLSWVLRFHDPERYGGPIGHRVPPHIRAALRKEWERERWTDTTEGAARSRASLADELEALRTRMTEPPGPNSSMMSRFAWSMTPRDFAALRHRSKTGEGPPDGSDPPDRGDPEPPPAPPPQEPEPEPTPPAPPRPTRADSEAHWAERDAARRLTEGADVWATGDPQDANANAAAHWEAMVEAGRIGGRE